MKNSQKEQYMLVLLLGLSSIAIFITAVLKPFPEFKEIPIILSLIVFAIACLLMALNIIKIIKVKTIEKEVM